MEIELITTCWQIINAYNRPLWELNLNSGLQMTFATQRKNWIPKRNNNHRKWRADLGHGNGNEGREKRDHDPSPNKRCWPTILKTRPIERRYPCEQCHRRERNRQSLEQCHFSSELLLVSELVEAPLRRVDPIECGLARLSQAGLGITLSRHDEILISVVLSDKGL